MIQLNNPNLVKTAHYVAGQWREGSASDTLVIENPANLTTLVQFGSADKKLINEAVDAADQAFVEWSKTSVEARADYLMRWHDLMDANQKDLAKLMTLEQGKPLEEALGEVHYAMSYFKWFAHCIVHSSGEYSDTLTSNNKRIVSYRPIGVAAQITPWNFPLAMLARKTAAALAAGCTVVAKPAELTPLTALAFSQLADEAGLPAGVFNCVVAAGKVAGEVFTGSDKIRKISFTGSTRVGKWLMENSAHQLHRLGLELGGNAPALVFDDADLDKAADAVMAAKFRNAGQTCICINRLYVARAVYEPFMERLAARVKKLAVGDGMQPDTTIGPLVNEAGRQKYQRHLENALTHGAKKVASASVSEKLTGYFVEPVLLRDATHSMEFCCEETFGPLLAAIPFDSEEQAIHFANDSEVGLASYAFTQNLARGVRLMDQIEAGMLGLNCSSISSAQAPFGGIKQSGFGREGALQGLREYQNEKYVLLEY